MIEVGQNVIIRPTRKASEDFIEKLGKGYVIATVFGKSSIGVCTLLLPKGFSIPGHSKIVLEGSYKGREILDLHETHLTPMVRLSAIHRLVLCGKCESWHPLQRGQSLLLSSLPKHKGLDGKQCPNSGYSYSALKYRIETPDEAAAVAQFFIEDHGRCLKSGGMHSLACGDGDACESTRLHWAKALAAYVLANA